MSADGALEGRCLCGAVSIALSDPAEAVEICQCDMCRRWGGAFYAALNGEEARISGKESVSIYRSSEWAERAFCACCGSMLWFRFLPTGNRSYSAGLFDGAKDHAIDREIFADRAVCWTELSGNHRRLTATEILAEARAAGFSFEK